MNATLHLVIQIGFGLITIVFFSLLVVEIRKGLAKSSIDPQRQKRIFNRMVTGLIVWTIFVSVWSLSGRMGDFTQFPFNMMPVLAIPLIASVIIVFSKTFKEIFQHIPQQNLIRLQSFRILVEILLWALFINEAAPIQMTFEGRNFDVLSGISALLVAYLVSRNSISKTALVIWNLACLGLLINIVTVAILSMPSFMRTFMNEPANTIVAQFPVSWLPGLLVPLAYVLHFFSLRQLSFRS